MDLLEWIKKNRETGSTRSGREREREEPVENYRFKVKQLILEINCDYGGAQNTAAGHDDDGGHAWISVD